VDRAVTEMMKYGGKKAGRVPAFFVSELYSLRSYIFS